MAAIKDISNKRALLNLAMAKLSQTPMTIEQPIYEPYHFNRISYKVSKNVTMNCYIVDCTTKTYKKCTLNSISCKNFIVDYGIKDNDPDRQTDLAETDSEKEISKFDKAPVKMMLSSVLNKYVNEGDNYKLLNLVAIQTQIDKDDKYEVDKTNEQDFSAKQPSNDTRLQSVVVVYNPNGGLGAGFYVHDDLVLTNYHVVEGAKFLDIKLFDGKKTFGKVIFSDIRLDLALIRVQARGKPVKIYHKKTLELGASVEAIGHPYGLEFSITKGVISALRKIESPYSPQGKPILFIQTDASISPGNSGGPLFLGDKVIGIDKGKIVGRGMEGLGFAIHYSEIIKFLAEFKNAGSS